MIHSINKRVDKNPYADLRPDFAEFSATATVRDNRNRKIVSLSPIKRILIVFSAPQMLFSQDCPSGNFKYILHFPHPFR